jgi:hypothetical protein
MGAPARRARGAHACLLIVVLASAAQAKHFRYGDMSWGVCRNAEVPYKVFYDPLFPEVCRTCSSPLCVGVTIQVAFKISGAVQAPFMENLDTDVQAYLDSEHAQRRLRLIRNMPSGDALETTELRIGYRIGNGDMSTVPDVADARSGIIDCSVPPCPKRASGEVDNYVFMIDRISDDGDTLFARYSFQLQLTMNGDYTVFFDGCCRPPEILNNKNLVFQLRTGIQLYAAGMPGGSAREYPKSSIKFYMPPVVHLRLQGNAYESPQCTPVCGAGSGQGACTLKFQIQALHSDDVYQSKIRYRLGSVSEMGHYRCVEHATLADPMSALVDNAMCREDSGAIAGYFQGPPQVTVDAETGIVTFLVAAEGQFQLTLVAECAGCVDASAPAVASSVTADLIVQVSDAPNNGNPPFATYVNNPFSSAEGITGVVPLTSRDRPLKIACGTPDFFLEEQVGGQVQRVYQREHVRVGYKDIDDTRFSCQAPGDDIRKIRPAGFLPAGVDYSGELQREVDLSVPKAKENPLGTGYIDVAWTPQCEDPSQVGLRMLCFEAQDKQAPYGGSDSQQAHYALFSTASPVRYQSSMASENPSCIYVDSLGPLVNPPPVISEPTLDRGCSGECCDCCGQEECACAQIRPCCANRYGTAGIEYRYTVRAFDPDPDTHVQFTFNFPAAMSIQPEVLEIKYGCAGEPYDTCVSQPEMTNDATTDIRCTHTHARTHTHTLTNDSATDIRWDLDAISLSLCSRSLSLSRTHALTHTHMHAHTDIRWDLTSLGEYKCKPAPRNASHVPADISCQSESDVTTCGPVSTGATACAKAKVKS